MTSDTVAAQPEILTDQAGSLGMITLNRPKALNSLTLAMVRDMDAALTRFEADPGIAAVWVSGAGERGLCAGGDIRQVLDSAKAGDGLSETFWREEYRVNARISHYPKPYVVIMDGITMGGGVGISSHGSHRIVTERLRLAMPETGIGFFPDVGASWLLTRKVGEFGLYLGLTGQMIGPADAIASGLADVFVPHEKLEVLRTALEALSRDAGAAGVSAAIAAFAENPPASAFTDAQRRLIDRAFAPDTIEAIFDALEGEQDEFATHTLSVLKSRSPTALKIAIRMLRLGRDSTDLEQCLDREFAGSVAILRLPDFHEGVRAAVVDKDRNPLWSPARLEDVTEASIAHFFEPHGEPPFGQQEGKP